MTRAERQSKRSAITQIGERFTDLSVVDVARANQRVSEAQELYDLFFADTNRAQLEEQRTGTKTRIRDLEDERSKLDREVGVTQDQITSFQGQLADSRLILEAAQQHGPLTDEAQLAGCRAGQGCEHARVIDSEGTRSWL